MRGDGHLSAVEIINSRTGEERTIETPAVFSFIGAVPRTDWLPTEIERDARGFVQTGPALGKSPHWTARRQPFLLETSRAGVFAAGDVRRFRQARRLCGRRGRHVSAICSRVSQGDVSALAMAPE
jgi:thioredoxin reductase (NADPH)